MFGSGYVILKTKFLCEIIVTIIFSLCVQSVNFPRWLTDDHTPSYNVLKDIARGRGPWSEDEAHWKLSISG